MRTNTQRNGGEMASPPKCGEDLMQLCQIESFTRRSTSLRRDDMLLVLCLNNTMSNQVFLLRGNILNILCTSHLLSDGAVNIKACIKERKQANPVPDKNRPKTKMLKQMKWVNVANVLTWQ